MALNSHYSGRMAKAITRTHDQATARSGKFYSILNSYGFYDVNDQNNGLTKEQREQVPVENQTRMSQLSSAIADMFAYFLSDGDNGIITNDMEDIVNKLDIRGSANAAQLNAVGSSLSALGQGPLAPLQSVNASRQMAEAQTASAMGSSPFNADLIPPIAIGLDGLPVSIANTFKSGFFQPNWDFLYQQESVKSTKFYFINGESRLGADIKLNQGNNTQLFIKNIFSVNTVDKNLTPVGDVKGGLTAEQYDIVRKAATMSETEIKADSKYSGFSLTDSQVQASFFRYVQNTIWDVINNRQNWEHSHWGALTHNSCPEYVKTAVCSFLKTNGLDIGKDKSTEGAFISYCITMGVYYLIGYQYPVALYGISGFDQIIDANGKASTVTSTAPIVASKGLVKSETIANQYFTWVADILLRLTYETNGEETASRLRKRRVAEANLIYKGLGKATVEYGSDPNKLDTFHTSSELIARKFNLLTNGTILRYSKTSVAGGAGANGALATPEAGDVTIKFDPDVKSSQLTELSAKVIKSLCKNAGITQVTITSLYRPPEIQAVTMFNNLQKNNRVSYAPPGKSVVAVYDKYKEKYGIASNTPFTDPDQIQTVKSGMLSVINNAPAEKVSTHSGSPTVVQAIDISPTRLTPPNKSESLRAILAQAHADGVLKAFLGPKPKGPGADPAYHIEIWQNDKAPKGFESVGSQNNVLPTDQYSMKNTNLTNINTMTALAALYKDYNRETLNTTGKKGD